MATLSPLKKLSWGTTPARWALISLFWLPISLFWGAVLGQVLQSKVEYFADQAHLGAFLSVITISGAVVALVVQLIIGPLSDACASRWGRRRPFLFWGTLLSVGAMLGFAWAKSFTGLVLAFMGIELFLNIANGPYQALIPDLVPTRQQGAASGWMGMMALLGDAGGPLAAGLLLAHAHTPAAQAHAVLLLMEGCAALLVICMLVTVLTVPDVPIPAHPRLGAGEVIGAALRSAYRFEIKRFPDFYWLLAARAAYNLGFYTALGFLAYYVEYALHQGPNYHKPLTAIQELTIGGALLGTLPAAYLADRVPKKYVITASSLFSVAAGIAFALTHSLTFAFVSAFLFGIGYGMYKAVDWAFACHLLPPNGGAKFMAIWSLSTMLPQLAWSAFGPAADRLNHMYGSGMGYRAAMLTIPIDVLFGLLLMRRVREKLPIASETSEALQ
jgi:Na+/melibiose symporter-like transporter